MFSRLGRRFTAPLILLGALAAGANAQFTIESNRLVLAGRPFIVRGMVYEPTPIGQAWSAQQRASPCLYPRDLPLIAALGANTVRTRARMPAGDETWGRALLDNRLYWLAGFPLDGYANGRSLSPGTAAGQELRETILTDFRAYVEAWRGHPRLIGFVFGDRVASDYSKKFSGSERDFFTLLNEAGALLDQAAPAALLTTAVAGHEPIGGFQFSSDDPNQPYLDFWTVDALGAGSIQPRLEALRTRTAKPLLLGAFGVDAYDEASQSEDPAAQASTAANVARQIDAFAAGEFFPLLGGLYASWVDEWWQGGLNPALHGIQGVAASNFPDGRLNPAWLGLFGAARGEFAGLDALRPREAYFSLAAAWGGRAPAELTHGPQPRIDLKGVRNTASNFEILSPGGLLSAYGVEFSLSDRESASASLPLHLGPVSACLANRPLHLYYAGPNQLRGQIPWSAPPGMAKVVVYRAGVPSNAADARLERAAPGIFPGAVYRPGLPCPVNEQNGVPAGSYLEVYGTGLGKPQLDVAAGAPLRAPVLSAEMPNARLGDQPIEVVYAGLYPGAPGVTQTNVRIPTEFPPSAAELRLEQAGYFSNPLMLQVIRDGAPPSFGLRVGAPQTVLLQEGGPEQRLWVTLEGANAFCDLVRFRFSGLPFGVRASIPVAYPGQTLPIILRAERGAPQTNDAPVIVTGFSSIPQEPAANFSISVLPGSGDIGLRVISGGWLSGAPIASFSFAGRVLHETNGGGPGRGINFITIDAQSGAIGQRRVFDTWASGEEVLAMERYLQSLPAGILVMAAIADDGYLLLRDQSYAVIRQALGSQQIDLLDYQYSWAIISRKGATQPIAERVMPNGRVVLDRIVTFPLPALP